MRLNPYGYKRAFTYTPTAEDRHWVDSTIGKAWQARRILDPTAGGGSIPIETHRLGYPTLANDVNPVAALILNATVEWPRAHGALLRAQFDDVAREFMNRAEPKYERVPSGTRKCSHRRLPLGAHGHLSVLRRSGSAVAQLARRVGRPGHPCEAPSRCRSGDGGACLLVRDR